MFKFSNIVWKFVVWILLVSPLILAAGLVWAPNVLTVVAVVVALIIATATAIGS